MSFDKIDEAVNKWLCEKQGMFSASELYKLCTKTDKEVGMFGKGAITYINQKAREARYLLNTDRWEGTYDMKRGKLLEPQAARLVQMMLGLDSDQLDYFGDSNPTFIKYNKHSGFSPDIISKDKSFGVEIKCPKEDVHDERLISLVYTSRKTGERADMLLKKECFNYWVQCQSSIMMCKAKFWFYCDFNELAPPSQQIILIRVEPDPIFQTDLRIRLTQAIKLKEERLKILNSI